MKGDGEMTNTGSNFSLIQLHGTNELGQKKRGELEKKAREAIREAGVKGVLETVPAYASFCGAEGESFPFFLLFSGGKDLLLLTKSLEKVGIKIMVVTPGGYLSSF